MRVIERLWFLVSHLTLLAQAQRQEIRTNGMRKHMRQEAIRPPRNGMIMVAIVTVFAMFAAYEFSVFSQQEAKKQAFIAQIMPHATTVVQNTGSASANSVMKSAVDSFSATTGPAAQMLPHFLVLASVMLTVLLLIGQRRGSDPTKRRTSQKSKREESIDARLQAEQRAMRQKLLEEKFRAEAASRAKTSFLAHLSHDVRTPLNHIIGFADLISHQTFGPLGDDRYLNYIKDIKTSGERLLGSFTDIMEMAQIESGQLALRNEQMTVASAMQAVADRYGNAARRANIQFEVSTPQEALLYCDRICIERMLGNIVQNAIQFTPSGGRIFMAGWVAEDGVVIEVSDNGIGISEERLKELSQPFALGDAAFTRETKGVGLGIAIARGIAELSGGLMEIDSNPAVGTTVAICLPRHKAAAKSKAA